MKKINLFKNIVLIIIVLLIIFIVVYSLLFVLPKNESKKEEEVTNGYILYDRDSNSYKEIFSMLKKLFNSEEIDKNLYATYVSKLFLMDLYTLNGKSGETDITASQYVLKGVRDTFVTKTSNTLYRNIGLNKELPVVSDVSTKEVVNSKYTYNNEEYDSYEVSCTITYEKDYGYDSNVLLKLIEKDNKLWIIHMETIDE